MGLSLFVRVLVRRDNHSSWDYLTALFLFELEQELFSWFHYHLVKLSSEPWITITIGGHFLEDWIESLVDRADRALDLFDRPKAVKEVILLGGKTFVNVGHLRHVCWYDVAICSSHFIQCSFDRVTAIVSTGRKPLRL